METQQLLKSNGMINPDAYIDKPKEKLAKLMETFPPEHFRMVLFSQFLMSKFPEGVEFKPQFVTVTEADVWDDKNAPQVGIKPGYVMLKSEKVIGLGQAVGIELTKAKDEVVMLGSEEYLCIEYIARLQLPDGTVVETPPSGKQVPLKTKSGSTQAHIHESCDRKAKRNAIKELLGIDTQIKKEDALKMWVCMKAVFNDQGTYSQNKVKTINAEATQAIEGLYDTGKPDPRKFFEEIKGATSMAELQAISARVTEAGFEEYDREALRGRLNSRYKELTTPQEDKL